jgi:hypothetical protein
MKSVMRLCAIAALAATLWGGDSSLSVKDFQAPSNQFRPIPFWAWTGDMHREQIQRQLRLMQEQRLPSVMIYPRFGMDVPYFSEEYLGLVQYSVEQAEKLGMKIWLYDEYTWPSGTAAKRIPREMPQYRSATLCAFRHLVAAHDARRSVDLRLPDDVLRVVAVSPTGEQRTIPFRSGQPLQWSAPAGAWQVQVFFVFHADDYVDSLNPEAVRRFIDITHEGYRRRLGKWFGNTIAGIFTDEPVMYHRAPARHDEYDVEPLPWTARMPEEFRAQHGYDLLERLPEALQGGAARRDLWATATRLYSESYHRQIGDWCRRNHIAYTGHILSEEPTSKLILTGGDYYSNLRWMDVPGIDEIQNRPGFGGDYPVRKISASVATSNRTPGEWVAPKLAQSTAEWAGRERTLVEEFALAPPSTTLNEMRRTLHWESVHGINTFLLAVFPASFRGAVVSTGWFPAFSWQQPWYRFYGEFSDYVARMSYLLTRGDRVSNVGMVYPSASCWGGTHIREDLDEPLRDLARRLLQSHRDFTVVFESGLEVAARRRFDALYVPPLASLEPALAAYLKAFQGKIYFYGRRPDNFAGGEVIGNQHFATAQAPGGVRVDSPDASRILMQQRKAGDATILFLTNISLKQTRATVHLPSGRKVERWDAATGRIAAAASPFEYVFEPGDGVFLVMRPGTPATPRTPPAPRVVELNGPWGFQAARENSLRLKGWRRAEGGRWETTVEIGAMPKRMELSLSQDLVQRAWVNGNLLDWKSTRSGYLDDHNREFDVTSLLRAGRNTIAVDPVYGREFPYLFYGYLLGHFSVRGGAIVAPVRSVSGPWTAAGYPEYAGTGVYSKTIDNPGGKVELELADVALDAVEVRVNGKAAGVRLWEPYRFDLTSLLQPGSNRLEIRVTNALGNLMFGPLPAGLTGPVRLLTTKDPQ